MILCTGSTGFVGSALASRLVGEGEQVVTIVRDRTGRPAPHGVIVVEGDICNGDLVQRVLAEYAVETIYHLASQSIVRACAEDPIAAFEVNVMGMLRILQAVRQAKRTITTVVSSSDKAYGHAPAPYVESTPFRPLGVYDNSKAAQDNAALMYHHEWGLDVRVVRAVNIYGPGDPNRSRLVPNTIRRLLEGKLPEVARGAGNMRRQWLYVNDAVEAFLTVCELGAPGNAYVVGGPDDPKSVLEIIHLIAAQFELVLGPPAEADGRGREIEEQWVNDTKLRGLGWKPHVNLAEGLRCTIAAQRAVQPPAGASAPRPFGGLG